MFGEVKPPGIVENPGTRAQLPDKFPKEDVRICPVWIRKFSYSRWRGPGFPFNRCMNSAVGSHYIFL